MVSAFPAIPVFPDGSVAIAPQRDCHCSEGVSPPPEVPYPGIGTQVCPPG
ncbi:hypothetical protein [Lysobacter gummosus]